jgi:hypothetical protein
VCSVGVEQEGKGASVGGWIFSYPTLEGDVPSVAGQFALFYFGRQWNIFFSRDSSLGPGMPSTLASSALSSSLSEGMGDVGRGGAPNLVPAS